MPTEETRKRWPPAYFTFADWLGTERARSLAGATTPCETITSLPFGDWMTTAGSCGDPSPMHFTGKEHDNETGLDNFGARYDSSQYGRFMTPDWSAKPTSVPYAVFNNPQSLNLYAYVQNNPVTNKDPDGHWCLFGKWGTTCQPPPPPPPPPSVHQVGYSIEKNAINQSSNDNSVGLRGNTKIAGGSFTASASATPSQLSAEASAGAEVHGMKTELNFSSNPDGSPGAANGKVNMGAFTADADAHVGTNGGGAKAEATVISFGGSLNLGKVTVTGTVNAVSIGGQFNLSTSGFAVGANYLLGADVTVEWGAHTIKTESAGEN